MAGDYFYVVTSIAAIELLLRRMPKLSFGIKTASVLTLVRLVILLNKTKVNFKTENDTSCN